MPEAYPDPSTGAVAMPSGHGADIFAFELDESYQAESALAYGPAVYDPWRSAATPHMMANVSALAKHGAAGKSPGFGAGTAGGAAATFTVHTGITLVGAFLVSRIRLAHSRARAIVGLNFEMHNAADVVTTWPIT